MILYKIRYLLIIVFFIFSCKDKIDYDGNRIFDKKPSAKSQAFLKIAGYANQAEIELGKLAMARGTHDSVKSLGRMMVFEHNKAQKDLIKISKTKKIKIPDTLDIPHQQLKGRLIRLNGYAFDTAYINSQISDHQKLLKDFQSEIKNGTDEDNLIYASKYFPYFQMHLNKITKIHDTVLKEK